VATVAAPVVLAASALLPAGSASTLSAGTAWLGPAITAAISAAGHPAVAEGNTTRDAAAVGMPGALWCATAPPNIMQGCAPSIIAGLQLLACGKLAICCGMG